MREFILQITITTSVYEIYIGTTNLISLEDYSKLKTVKDPYSGETFKKGFICSLK